MTSSPVTTLFLDIGGVLLSNGWDRHMRRKAAQHFDLDYEEMDERHHLTFDTYEEGRLSLEEYLDRVVFHRERPFSREDFRTFMFDQSRPYPETIDLVRRLKARHRLKTVAVSNEGRELTEYRIRRFDLAGLIDFFVSSCFVHTRKPDPGIYQMALDMAQVEPRQVVYCDDRKMFADVAGGLGIHGIHHTGFEATRSALAGFGLEDGRGGRTKP